MYCPEWAKGRGDILRKAKDRSFKAMMNSPEDISRITKWIQKEGWLEQFRLSIEVERVVGQRQEERTKGLRRNSHWK
ncbi:hypothetical protein EV44_g3838 [Erysiphe necator]|uniref:Uncharacterized protein n=1 Tax=Uncinula necator TaxID=52586 RepID=A0A0B1PAC9_UNCNE|nr:hypothetical protein EV44_g3838 [Erysiphe necator]